MGADMTGMTGEVYSQMQTAPGMNAVPPQFVGASLPPPLPPMNASPTLPVSMGTEAIAPPPMLQTMSGQLAPMSYSAAQPNCPTCNHR